MLSVEQARDAVILGVRAVGDVEQVSLGEANGRFLAQDVRAQIDHPLFDNSAMDGYAVNSSDLVMHDQVLPLAGTSRCGDAPSTLTAGSAMRIFTGAPLPAGANAVVIQEEVKQAGARVVVCAPVQPGANVRRQGEDFRAGDMLYSYGRRLSALDIALLGTAGVAQLKVYRRARALVLATGDELVQPSARLKPGQIYESNRLVTALQLQDLGVVVDDGGIVRDDLAALRRVLARANDYDFVITSGGASVGDHDLVKQVFSEIGEINFWKVKIKPGKPLAFGRIGEGAHFFALPGNPVSSLVTFKLFVEPAIYAWNHAAPIQLQLKATAVDGFHRSAGRTEFLRAHVYARAGTLYARALSAQGSHMVGALRETNALIRVEAEDRGFERGDQVAVIPLVLDSWQTTPAQLATHGWQTTPG